MSKVAIQGNASGTGTFTIAAPNSNTDRTLTLPDEAGTVLTSASDIPASSVTGLTQGITEADQFYLTTNLTGNGDVIGNLDRIGLKGFSKIGTGMSKDANGIFTFPQTGLYMVFVSIHFNIDGADTVILQTQVTTNNSTYDVVTEALTEHKGTGDANGYASSFYYVNVTDTSNVKVKFSTSSMSGNSRLNGDATKASTSFSFVRLGDAQ